ncbi:unnamed protein product [Peronospora belbahrii]|uniref:SPRY domain-containing protein n=1 Tax=Peronospora belbahrii TaxID=622444 RepID=A0AAU9KTB6_9STRA|nr:unnamed protein product [Peronospora belbahrii]
MGFDPRCVAFEGRLHADYCTAEYVGRASHQLDAACFRSIHSVSLNGRCKMLRVYYYETQIMATLRPGHSIPGLHNIPVSTRRGAVQDPETGSSTIPPQTHEEHNETVSSTRRESVEIPVHFNLNLTSTTRESMPLRRNRSLAPRGNERKQFNHKIAVGFLVDDVEQKVGALESISTSFTRFSRSSGYLEAQMSRQAVKQLMQRFLPHVAAQDESREENQEKKSGEKQEKVTFPAILHEDLGERVNSIAYVGNTGRVVSNGREFLQCERYGEGDVVGCGVLLDTNTFFFTLNGKLMGLLPARDVYDMDHFGQVENVAQEESDEDDWESGEEENDKDSGRANKGAMDQLDTEHNGNMEEINGRYEDEKVLFPSVSLHGVGECVRAVFEPDDFQFDLLGFEQQIQKERQQALLAEREKHNDNGHSCSYEQLLCKDEAATNEFVRDFFLHYGYESAYKAFESTVGSSNRQRLTSNDMEIDYANEGKPIAVIHDVSSANDTENEDKVYGRDPQLSLQPSVKQMRESLSLRHEMREHIRSFRTAQVLEMLEQHVPALMTIEMGHYSRRVRKLILYCRILCVIDILIHDGEGKASALSASLVNGAPRSLDASNQEKVGCNRWNAESAIAFARQVFGSSVEITANGKRKRLGFSNGTHAKRADRHEVALAMSLLLYNQRESIPETSRAQKFLTCEFRESVADELNNLLLMGDDYAKMEPRISALETFMTDLDSLQKECVHQGCRVYPESVEATSNGKPTITSRRWRTSVSSSSDDSSSIQTEQDDRFDDDDNDDE